jgi:methyl-accepting chemotaxis protein
LFRNLTFASKALLVSAAFVVPAVCLLAWLLVSQGEQEMSVRMDATRQHVEIAFGAVEFAHARQVSGEISQYAAQQLAKQTLARMRYNQSDYFFILDMQPVMLMHPIKPELVGKNVRGLKDSHGTAMWSAMAEVVRKQDKGFVNYL